MSISKDVIKQCLISKQREVDEAVIVNRPIDFEKNGNYVIVGVRHTGKSYLLYPVSYTHLTLPTTPYV